MSVCLSLYVYCHLSICFPIYFSYQDVFHRFDKDQSGDMNLYELRDALSALGKTVTIFFLISIFFLEDFSFYLLFFTFVSQFTIVYSSVGYRLSNTALSSIHLRYHNKKGTIPFDIFIQILVRVIVMFGKLNWPILTLIFDRSYFSKREVINFHCRNSPLKSKLVLFKSAILPNLTYCHLVCRAFLQSERHSKV